MSPKYVKSSKTDKHMVKRILLSIVMLVLIAYLVIAVSAFNWSAI